MRKLFYCAISLSLLMACHPGKKDVTGCSRVDMRKALAAGSPVSLKEEIAKIEYIPLETNDSCLISNILGLQITKDYIFTFQGRDGAICQFDRSGKFIRKISRTGNGPGEVSDILSIAVNDGAKELYIFQPRDKTQCFSFDGEFLRSDENLENISAMSCFADGSCAVKGRTMSPVAESPWAGALWDKDGKSMVTKSVFAEPLDSSVCFMSEIVMSPAVGSTLLFSESNDTVFRISPQGIAPAYWLDRKNAPEYYKQVSDISQFKGQGAFPEGTINVYDMLETENNLYLRIFNQEDFYIVRLNRRTGDINSYKVPQDYLDASILMPGVNCIGFENDIDGGVPVWTEFSSSVPGEYAQIITCDMLDKLKGKGYLKNVPFTLNIGEDDNPVIAVYTLK